MPCGGLLDKLIGSMGYAPFKCRACRAKFYRRSETVSKRLAPPVESEPARSVAVCHGDPTDTLRRVENIIRIAEARRVRKG